MKLECTNPECGRVWDYIGKKRYPSYVSCPDCHKNVKLPNDQHD